MKIKFLKLKNWLLVTLMGALGLTACHSHKKLADPEEEPEPVELRGRGDVMLMYGVPTMNYMIRGQVRDADGKPVQGIRINMLEHGMEVNANAELQGDPERVKEYLENTSVETDARGRFTIAANGRPQEQVRLLIRDVDGTQNGEYRDQMVEMEVGGDNIDRTDANGWHQGTYHNKVEINLENK